MSEWKPIETAPKEKFVLIAGGTFWWAGESRRHEWKGVAIGYRSNQGWCSGYCGSDDDQFWHEPTHWMELPEPPK